MIVIKKIIFQLTYYLKVLYHSFFCEMVDIQKKYIFKRYDLILFFFEKFKIYSNVLERDNYNNFFDKITINRQKILFPKDFSDSQLVYIYSEVFENFLINPSSYAHPKIKYHELKWIIDSGCSESFFSLFAYNKGFSGNLFAIEPMKEFADSTRETFRLNNFKNTKVIEAGLSDSMGKQSIYFDAKNIFDSSIKKLTESSSEKTVFLTTLDQIYSDQNLLGRGLIKMDIEGSEVAALSASKKLLTDLKPFLAIAVYHSFQNAYLCKEIILKHNPSYKVEFRGCWGYKNPPRPYMLFAY
jgi:FkbM family methyltransferase